MPHHRGVISCNIDPDSGYIGIRYGFSTCTVRFGPEDMLMTDDELIDRYIRPMLCAVRQREADRKAGVDV